MIRTETVKFEIQREEERVNRTTSGTRSATNELPRPRRMTLASSSELVFIRKLPQRMIRKLYSVYLRARARRGVSAR